MMQRRLLPKRKHINPPNIHTLHTYTLKQTRKHKYIKEFTISLQF